MKTEFELRADECGGRRKKADFPKEIRPAAFYEISHRPSFGFAEINTLSLRG